MSQLAQPAKYLTSLTQHIWPVSGFKYIYFLIHKQEKGKGVMFVQCCQPLNTCLHRGGCSLEGLWQKCIRFCLSTGFCYQQVHKQNMNWNNQLTPLSLSLMPSFIEIYSLRGVEFLTSNFIKCHACKHSIVLTVQGTQTHFLLHMYDGEEISMWMFFPLLINCKWQIFSFIFKWDIFTLASS